MLLVGAEKYIQNGSLMTSDPQVPFTKMTKACENLQICVYDPILSTVVHFIYSYIFAIFLYLFPSFFFLSSPFFVFPFSPSFSFPSYSHPFLPSSFNLSSLLYSYFIPLRPSFSLFLPSLPTAGLQTIFWLTSSVWLAAYLSKQ